MTDFLDQGYGIRILPSYVDSLKASKLRMEEIAERARAWTNKVMKYSIRNVNGYAELDMRDQVTEAPQNRSCLTGFEYVLYSVVPLLLFTFAFTSSPRLLMRHVALWEADCAGHIKIRDSAPFASVGYDEAFGDVSYDDTPRSVQFIRFSETRQTKPQGHASFCTHRFAWDTTFRMGPFIWSMTFLNEKERDANKGSEILSGDAFEIIRRISYAPSLDEILDARHDIVIPIFLEESFVTFANALVEQALQDHGFHEEAPITVAPLADGASNELTGFPEDLYLWRISAVTMWQQLDRRIDE